MADRPAPECDEIKITPEMIEAGRDAYYAVPRYPGDAAIDEETLVAVYLAMLMVSIQVRA